MPEKVIPILGTVSGLSIFAIGDWLLIKRLSRFQGHTHEHIDQLEAEWASNHPQMSFLACKTAYVHTHALPDEQVLGSLIALGASGGLVPCPSALVLMLSVIVLSHTLLGLGLLVSFSTGVAAVLMGIGALVIYAKNLPSDESRVRSHPAFRFVPVFSAVVVMALGGVDDVEFARHLSAFAFLSS